MTLGRSSISLLEKLVCFETYLLYRFFLIIWMGEKSPPKLAINYNGQKCGNYNLGKNIVIYKRREGGREKEKKRKLQYRYRKRNISERTFGWRFVREQDNLICWTSTGLTRLLKQEVIKGQVVLRISNVEQTSVSLTCVRIVKGAS